MQVLRAVRFPQPVPNTIPKKSVRVFVSAFSSSLVGELPRDSRYWPFPSFSDHYWPYLMTLLPDPHEVSARLIGAACLFAINRGVGGACCIIPSIRVLRARGEICQNAFTFSIPFLVFNQDGNNKFT